MAPVLQDVLAANEAYAASFGDKGKLAMPPARRFAILTCMDARLDPAKYAGLAEGDAHVIRNAGGRATDDAIRSLVISTKLLGTREWFVIHHTNCDGDVHRPGDGRSAGKKPRHCTARRRRLARRRQGPGLGRRQVH
jgi:carbonic anhydrase